MTEQSPEPEVVAVDPPEHPIEPLDAGCGCDAKEEGGGDAV